MKEYTGDDAFNGDEFKEQFIRKEEVKNHKINEFAEMPECLKRFTMSKTKELSDDIGDTTPNERERVGNYMMVKCCFNSRYK